MDVAALVISLLALVASGAAVWYTRRQAIAGDRQALAAERQIALAEAEAAKYKAPWVPQYVSGDLYSLVNDGAEPVYDVEVEGPPHSWVDVRSECERVGAGSAVGVMVALSMGCPHSNITVTWAREPGGEKHRWTSPLPARN